VAKSLCHFAKFRAVSLNAFSSASKLAKVLAPPVDVVVATPTKLQQLLDANSLSLGDVGW
jgi:superfamily II DNA/RNA helicase